MQLLVLGPLAIVRDDATLVELGGARQRALVALLAVHAPAPVSVDALVEALWGDGGSSDPVGALHVRISQLRRRLGADVVKRVGTGYALAIDDVDALAMERLVVEGRAALDAGDAATAAARLRAGLAHWRDEPMAEHHDLDAVRAAASGWRERYLAGHEDLVEAELALGRHDEVAVRLAELVAAHPLRERLRARFMVALYRAGRQTEALRVGHEGRRILADELGLEPGPELVEVERAILEHDPTLRIGSATFVAAPACAAVAAAPPLPPLPLTRIIGRDDELDRLVERLSSVRLVTLTGPGGTGKSRLALEVAHRVPACAAVVPLAGVADGDGVAEAIAIAVGARAAASESGHLPSALERMLELLSVGSGLLVLDDCEHVAATVAATARDLLAACPGLRIIATSRVPLGVAGEQLWPVAPLDADHAVELFADRASLACPRFVLDDTTRPVVEEVTAALDGLPLALELAAVQLRWLPAGELAARIEERLDLLRATARDAESRHRTLRATIEWSHDLLSAEQRTLLRRVAVLPGGFTAEAAGVVGGLGDALSVEHALAGLVDASLLVLEERRSGPRYRMLESVRAYASERLADAGETTAAEEARERWAVSLADRAGPGALGRDQLRWLAVVDDEHDNLAAAIDRMLLVAPPLAARVAGRLALAWWLIGRSVEARAWLDVAIGRNADGPADPVDLSRVLLWAAFLATAHGWADAPDTARAEIELAFRRIDDAIALATASGDRVALAHATQHQAIALLRRSVFGGRSELERAVSVLDEAGAVLATSGDRWGAGMSEVMAALCLLLDGDLEGASRRCDRASTLLEPVGERYALERLSWIRGTIAHERGDDVTARREYHHALELATVLGFRGSVAAHAAQLAALEGDGSREATTGSALIADNVATLAAAANHRGLRLRRAGDAVGAVAAHRRAVEGYGRLGLPAAEAVSTALLALAVRDLGDLDGAVALVDAALDRAGATGDDATAATLLRCAAVVASYRDDGALDAASLLGRADVAASREDGSGIELLAPEVDGAVARGRAAIGRQRFDRERAAARLEAGDRV